MRIDNLKKQTHNFVELDNGIRVPQDMIDFYNSDSIKLYKEFLGIPKSDSIIGKIDHLHIKKNEGLKEIKVLYCIRYKENNKPIAMGICPDGKLLIDINHDIRTCNFFYEKADAETVFDICSQDKEFEKQYYIDTLTEDELDEIMEFNCSTQLIKSLEAFKELGIIKEY